MTFHTPSWLAILIPFLVGGAMRRAAQSTNTPGVPLKDNGASDEIMFQLTPLQVTAGDKG